MRVYIITEGGRKIGFGHVTRCAAIYQAFEEFNIQPQLLINSDETISNLPKDTNSKAFDWLNDRETLFAALRDADIVFIDSYLANYDLYEKISNIVKTAVYFDDNIRLNYPKGFVVNGAIFAEQMPYPERKEVTYLLGAQYAPLRKEFWDVPAKPIRDTLKTAMITFGGADILNLTPKALKVLADTYPQLSVKVIIGRGFQNTKEIEALKNSNTELIYYPDATEMRKVMLESDIAISACGQTLYEFARVEVPTIGICVAKNQLQNIEGWRESGFLEYVGWYNNANLEQRLTSSVRRLMSKRIRMRKSNMAREIIDGQGCKRIINAINTR